MFSKNTMFLDVSARECIMLLYIGVLMLHIPVLFPRYVEKGCIVSDKHLSDDFPVFLPGQ